jgi:hypothetical protein
LKLLICLAAKILVLLLHQLFKLVLAVILVRLWILGLPWCGSIGGFRLSIGSVLGPCIGSFLFVLIVSVRAREVKLLFTGPDHSVPRFGRRYYPCGLCFGLNT